LGIINSEGGAFKSHGETLTIRERLQRFGLYLSREAIILVLLSALAVVLFAAVGALSRIYHAHRDSLGNRWSSRGVADLKLRQFDRAVSEFRTALLYSRDSYAYQLNLAQALLGLGRTDEANAYLINLWEREPENGLVNLELARIAAEKGATEQALRYYNNAIYATWPDDQEEQRRAARLELIEFLLGTKEKAQAQSELIALAANLGNDPSQHARVGDLFVRAQDYEHALGEYRLALKLDHRNPATLAAAGNAAFDLGRYDLAERYLRAAVSADPSNAENANRLKTAEMVLQMDPFRRQITVDRRDRIVIEAFAAAGERLKSCPAAANWRGLVPSATSQPSLAESWTKIKPQITERGLRRTPDLVETAMDLVFEIERRTNGLCGPPSGTDLALLLISKLHEGN
jgi:tetratricopeptide (TPR) repeat protein